LLKHGIYGVAYLVDLKQISKRLNRQPPTTEEIYAWLTGHSLVCEYSGIKLDVSDITVDHRTPIARGGTNELENLAICSNHMNTAKGRMNEYEFRSLLKIIKHWEDGGQGILKRLKQGHFG
jgi:5-methylcytosine-specific restriction endonuclease McrA